MRATRDLHAHSAMETLTLRSGRTLQMEWDLPRQARVPGGREGAPLAFLMPPAGAKDLNGNATALRIRNFLRDLSRVFTELGFATFRFALKEPGLELSLAEKLEAYARSARHPGVSPHDTVLVGMREEADLIARAYYDFFGVRSPGAAILLAPSAKVIHLNNLTCPYLLLHGTGDPTFHSMPYHRFLDAIHHHQIRYGDQTASRLIPGTDQEMGDESLSPLVLEEIRDWVPTLLREGTRRPQERSA